MSNRLLLGWLRDYSIKNRANVPTRSRFLSDFGRAVVEQGGQHVVLALLRGSIAKEDLLNFDEVWLHVIFGGFGIFRDDDPGTGTDSGTNTGTGTDSGTNTGTGTFTGITLNTFITDTPHTGTFGTGTFTGTSIFTQTGITRSPFTGPGTFGPNEASSIFGSLHVIVTLEALAQYAIQLRDTGALDIIEDE
jgi:hypothetical protein